MKRQKNSAEELNATLSKILDSDRSVYGDPHNNPFLRDVISSALEVNITRTGEFYLTIADLVQMPSRVISDLKELDDRVPLGLILNPIEELEKYLDKEMHFGLKINNFANSITEEMRNSLTHAEYYLNGSVDIENIDEDSKNLSELTALKKTLDTLLTQVDNSSELPDDLRTFLVVHIFKLMEAIQDYQKKGNFSSLKYATDAIIAELIRNSDLREASYSAEEECQTFSKVLNNLMTIIGTANDFVQGIENLEKLRELPFFG